MESEVDSTANRRMIFAAAFLPHDIPHYWDIVAEFANQHNPGKSRVTKESAKVVVENLQVLKPNIFSTDSSLRDELINMKYDVTGQPLGIPLVSSKKSCLSCDGRLLLRNDRASYLILYTESLGTVPATQFYKYCQNYRKGCKFVQYYGHYSVGDATKYYSNDWMTLPYFLSSQETGFEMSMLKKYDIELLIGQMSYKQKADIYNVEKRYDTTKKECSTIEKEKVPRKPPVHRYVFCVSLKSFVRDCGIHCH